MTELSRDGIEDAAPAARSRRRALLCLGGVPLLALSPPAWSLTPGVAAPPCVVATPDGKGSLSVAEQKGKILYLDFWASWCPPCRESFPFLNELHRELTPRGLAMLAVSVDKSADDARRFMERYVPEFPVGIDPAWACASAYLLPGMPTSFVIDRAGIVVKQRVGFRNDDKPRIRAELVELLA